MTEERVTSATGGQKGRKDCELFSLPPWAVEQLGNVFGMGARKYDAHNYRQGYDVALSINALTRHLLQWLDGKDEDDESGLNHLAHVAWHALAAMQIVHDHPQYDTRYKREATSEAEEALAAEPTVRRTNKTNSPRIPELTPEGVAKRTAEGNLSWTKQFSEDTWTEELERPMNVPPLTLREQGPA